MIDTLGRIFLIERNEAVPDVRTGRVFDFDDPTATHGKRMELTK